ncbi:hypothetical protein D9M71_642450 [compost metagenome]
MRDVPGRAIGKAHFLQPVITGSIAIEVVADHNLVGAAFETEDQIVAAAAYSNVAGSDIGAKLDGIDLAGIGVVVEHRVLAPAAL